MIIKINTELGSYRGIPLIVDDEVIDDEDYWISDDDGEDGGDSK